eukprot:4159282-Lingulodinium_polyedra.AAC.1
MKRAEDETGRGCNGPWAKRSRTKRGEDETVEETVALCGVQGAFVQALFAGTARSSESDSP